MRGCLFSGETDHLRYNTDQIDQDVLLQFLNKDLFFEVYTSVLDSLHTAFEEFKKDDKYLFLREDIRRQEKLYEVMIEGSFVEDS